MVDSRQKRTTRREAPVPTSNENRKPEAQEARAQTPGGPTPSGHDGPGRLNEAAAGGMGSLLMTQPVRWPGVVAGFRQRSPDAFGKLARWPARTARTGTRALRSFLFFSL